MPATLTAPGLYLRRAETPPPPLGSAITGFVGVPERGPINSPQPLTGWSDYVDTFGSFIPFGYLAESVFAFFRNGGEKCWVVRAADTSRIGATTPAGQCVQSTPLATASANFADHDGTATVRILALDPGGWGNKLEVRIGTSALRPLRIGTLTQETTAATTQLEISSILDLRPGLKIRITDPDGVSNGTDRTIASGAAALNLTTRRVDVTAQVDRVFLVGSVVYAPGFRIEAAFRGRRESFDPVSMRADDPRYFPSVINAPPTMTDYGERRRRGFSSLIRVEHVLTSGASRFRPGDTAIDGTLAGGDDGFTQARETFRNSAAAPLVTIVAKGDRGSAGNSLHVVAIPFGARTTLPSPDASGAKNRVVVDEIRGFQVGEQIRVGVATSATFETATPSQVLPDAMMLRLPGDLTRTHAVGEPVMVADRFTLEARRTGEREPREVVRNLSGDATVGARFIRTVLQTESTLLCASTPPAAFTTPILAGATSASITLTGGADPGAMDARYYTGYQNDGSYFHPAELPPGTRVGLATLELVEEISLVSVPDVTRVATTSLVAAQTNILRHCARLGDRFALLDSPIVVPPPPDQRPVPPTFTTEDWVRSLGNAELRKFGAAFHPRVWGTFEGLDSLTPPSGAVAGLIARTDAELGVNKAPANDRLKGVFGLDPAIDRKRQGELNPLGVNCVVKLEDGEISLMGSRTLSDDPVARYINVRRTILSVKKTLSQRMLWAVFEPINDALYRRLEATLVTYLQALLARGVTASQRPGDAFYVRCNADTNPPEQQRLGIVVAEVGLALLAPAEFIVLTVRRTPDAVQVIEEDA
jgi:hypothetical protein